MAMAKEIVVISLNSGSSSLKFALYNLGTRTERLIAAGAVERIGLAAGGFTLRDGEKEIIREKNTFADHRQAVEAVWQACERLQLPLPAAAGHRLVHGGRRFTNPALIDEELLAEVEKLIPFAPLHLPGELQGIAAVSDYLPGLPQVACFDTAFHRRMPETAQRLPLPVEFWQKGIIRYGFHGLSYEYILSTFGKNPPPRLIIAHLGNGASLAAVGDGRPLETTMGFTPAGGTMMGTRSGDLDPGVLVYLMRQRGYDAEQIDNLINHQAGLLGVSGLSRDMKALLASTEPAAELAVEMFSYYVRKHIGALAAVLGGVDTLVFTGGIGERAAPVRQKICRGLEFLGLEIDQESNAAQAEIISTADSRCQVRVTTTKEDLIIARHTREVLARR